MLALTSTEHHRATSQSTPSPRRGMKQPEPSTLSASQPLLKREGGCVWVGGGVGVCGCGWPAPATTALYRY